MLKHKLGSAHTVAGLSLLLFSGELRLSAGDPEFLNVFPQSPNITGLSYSGQLSYSETYSPSGSQWAPGLDEREVFFASLKHADSASATWEVRVGKGGQLYSIRGPYGESQAPQTQPDAHWIDQIFQLIGVDQALNLTTPDHAYFIHQAGDYLDDPILTTTFYSPMLARNFDSGSNAFSVLNWGQQAHIPNVNQAGLLYYDRVKDLGSGVIEITYVIYNFGQDLIDYHDTPWGGVRKSVLPVTLASNPDGSATVVSALFGDGKALNLKDTGGWIAWTEDSTNQASPTLAVVLGKDITPMPSYQYAPARFRYGTGPAVNDFEVVEATPFIRQAPGSAFFFRVYMVSGTLGTVSSLANTLSASATHGQVNFTEDNADLVPVYLQTTNGQTVLTTSGPAGQSPAFYTYAEPVANSLPLFVLQSTQTGQLRLSTNPCELCTKVQLGTGEFVYKPYDGTIQYVGFLGYVLPAQYIQSKAPIYENLMDVVTDRSYFPVSAVNGTLKAVAGKVNITSVNVSGGGVNIAQNTFIELRGTNLAPNAVGPGGLNWGSAPEFASGKMPTQLDGVSVTVNGKPAYVNYISSTQVNVLTPLDTALGSVQIQLTNGTNVSAPFTAHMNAVAPAFFLLSGSSYVVATHADNSLVGPMSLSVPGYPFSPAQPPETLQLYGNGCGLPAAGLVQGSATQSGALPAFPSVQIGGSTASVTYAGLAGPGLCQINVAVPLSTPRGDNPINASFGSASTPSGALINVGP